MLIVNRFVGEFEHIHNVVPEPDRNDSFSPHALKLKDFRNESVLKASPTGYRVIKSHWSLQDYERINEGEYLIEKALEGKLSLRSVFHSAF